MPTRDKILKTYYSLLNTFTRIPTELDLLDKGITRAMVRSSFGNFSRLLEQAFEEDNDAFSKLKGPINFTCKKDKDEYIKQINNTIKEYDKIVVTAYANGSKVCTQFLRNLKYYCKKNNALLVIMPIAGPSSNFNTLPDGTDIYWNIDPQIHKELFILDDTRINIKLLLSSIKLSTKHINPLTGLHRLSQRNGSFVYGSPKHFLDSVATSNIRTPSILLTTGVINHPNYNGKFYMMNRTDKLAESDHTIGALVLEVQDTRHFFSRQIQAGKSYELYDLGVRYRNNRMSTQHTDAIVLGDIHADELDPAAFSASKEMIKQLKPRYIIAHDLFNGTAINHHTQHNLIELAMLSDRNRLSLQKEIKVTAEVIKDLLSVNNTSELVIVASNHNEFLDRYLDEGRYLKDHLNKSYATYLVNSVLNDNEKNPLKFAINNCGVLSKEEKKRVRWLDRDEDFKLHGIELGAHGDKGSNGTRASANSLERAYHNIICGHSHSPKIMRGVWIAGVNCKLKLDYNVGPSSWIHANIVLNKNGCRQLLTIINGKWKLKN